MRSQTRWESAEAGVEACAYVEIHGCDEAAAYSVQDDDRVRSRAEFQHVSEKSGKGEETKDGCVERPQSAEGNVPVILQSFHWLFLLCRRDGLGRGVVAALLRD